MSQTLSPEFSVLYPTGWPKVASLHEHQRDSNPTSTELSSVSLKTMSSIRKAPPIKEIIDKLYFIKI